MAALHALGDLPSEESARVLVEALSSRDGVTRIAAAREIGRGNVVAALPALHKVLERYHLIERDLAFKTEVVGSVRAIGSPTSIDVLRKVATRSFAFGGANRTLKRLAGEALADIESRSR
jgi:HEAT repeat protein